MCIAVSFLATACNWFSHQPKNDGPVVVNNDGGDSLNGDSSQLLKNSKAAMPDTMAKTGKSK